jgi:hypothetical protein
VTRTKTLDKPLAFTLGSYRFIRDKYGDWERTNPDPTLGNKFSCLEEHEILLAEEVVRLAQIIERAKQELSDA